MIAVISVIIVYGICTGGFGQKEPVPPVPVPIPATTTMPSGTFSTIIPKGISLSDRDLDEIVDIITASGIQSV